MNKKGYIDPGTEILFSNIKIKKNSFNQISITSTVLDILGIKISKNIDRKNLLE